MPASPTDPTPMSPHTPNPPMPIVPPPAGVDEDLALLLAEPLASGWAQAAPQGDAVAALHDRLAARLAERLQASRQAEAGFTTVRRRSAPRQPLAEGVSAQWLYRAAAPPTPAGPPAQRCGEPWRALLIELAPGARFQGDGRLAGLDAAELQREWLLLSGSASVVAGSAAWWLSQRDYLVVPPGQPPAAWHSEGGALLFLRESWQPGAAGAAPVIVRDAEAGWPDFAPGIRRRVLWQRDGEAAMLYHADPGAQVPVHRHGHDEECLMVQGELFLDDLLLQAGDYQLAPAGSGHRITETDTGVVIYAHGDLDLQFVA